MLAHRDAVDGQLAFARINVEEVPDVVEMLGVNKEMPTFMVLQDGKPVQPEDEFGAPPVLEGVDANPGTLTGLVHVLEDIPGDRGCLKGGLLL